jgi:hypothetical protein
MNIRLLISACLQSIARKILKEEPKNKSNAVFLSLRQYNKKNASLQKPRHHSLLTNFDIHETKL